MPGLYGQGLRYFHLMPDSRILLPLMQIIFPLDDQTKSIHECDFSLICEYFSMLERQGPGSREMTLRALSFKQYSRIS